MTETKLIYQKMAAILKDTDAIAKNKKNASQGFNFRGIDDVMNELHGSFAKHGVFLTTKVLEIKRSSNPTKSGGLMHHQFQKIRFTFHAEDGSSVSSVCYGEAMDTGDKASNKCMSIALKYCLLQAFLIPTEDMVDPDGESPKAQFDFEKSQHLYSDKDKSWLFGLFKEFGVADYPDFMKKMSTDVKGMQIHKIRAYLEPKAMEFLKGQKQ